MNKIKPSFAFYLFWVLVGLVNGLKDPICGQKPASQGFGGIVCYAYMPSYTYYSNKNECSQFIYGGCGANNNIFSTKEKCEAKCKE